MLFKWQPALETGIQEIDNQHKQLVDMLNELHSAMSKGKGKDALGHLIEEMIHYTKTHFQTEEEYFDQFDYAHAEQHTQKHKEFVDKVSDFKQKMDSGQTLLTIEVMGFLRDWLFQHIAKTDKHYVELFKSKGLH